MNRQNRRGRRQEAPANRIATSCDPVRTSVVPCCVVAGLLMLACSEKLPTKETQQTPQITHIEVPEMVFQQPAATPYIRVQASDPQGPADLAAVMLSIKWLPSGTQVSERAMRDDGQDGDVLAGDGIYVLAFSAALTANSAGVFLLEAQARDHGGSLSDVARDTLTVIAGAENQPPQLLSALAPDSVWLDSTYSFPLRATASDGDGLATLRSVLIHVFPPAYPTPSAEDSLFDDGTHGDGAAADGQFANYFSPALFNKGRGRYEILFRGRDQAGSTSRAILRRVQAVVRVANQPPQLSSLQAPSAISRRTAGTAYVLSVRVIDPNGAEDIKQVLYNIFLPDGSAALNNPFLMRDDGLEGDATAGDGRYSRTTTVSPTAPLGNYRFEFQAEDRQGAISPKLVHTITVTD